MMIRLENVSKRFGDKEVLKNITAEFYRGELVFVSGTSGAGKSTLLNIIGGLDCPSEGMVLCDGKDIAQDLYSFRAEKVGFVFQEANLIPGMSVSQNITIATELSGVAADKKLIDDGIADLGIKDPMQRVETLSGGEKQRVAVLRSLYKDAEVILADEPTGSLDSTNAKTVFDTLRKLADNKCVIVVSHDIELARQYADRVITLQDGRILEETEIRTKRESPIEPDKSRNKKQVLREIVFPLGKNSIRIRKGKIASVVATIAMAITAITMVIGIAGIGNRITGTVNVSYLESDLIHAFYGHMPNTEYGNFPFTDSDREYLENYPEIQEVVWQYYGIDGNWFFRNESSEAEAKIKQINLDGFFRERVMTNDITGHFPQSESEIVLAADVARRLFGTEDVLGRDIVLCGSSGQSISFTISGINHTKNPYDDILSFVSADRLKAYFGEELSKEVFLRQELDIFQEGVSMGFQSGGIYGAMQPIDEKEKLLYGTFPTEENRIMISSTLLSYGMDLFGLNEKYTLEDILSGEVSRDDLERIMSTRLAIDYNGVFGVYICGVYISDAVELRYTPDLILRLQKPDPVSVDLYVKDTSKVSEICRQLSATKGFEAETNQETLKRAILSQSLFFQMALMVLGVILAWISILLLNSYSKISALERRKEIAILKSLGAADRTVLEVLLFDSFAIAAASTVCAMALSILARFVASKAVPQILFVSIPSVLVTALLVGIIFTLMIVLLTIISMRSFVRKMPAELFLQQ